MVKVKKGARGRIGEAVKAPGGKYVHRRKAAPDKSVRYVTVKRRDKLVRVMYKNGKSKAQAVLTPIKKKR